MSQGTWPTKNQWRLIKIREHREAKQRSYDYWQATRPDVNKHFDELYEERKMEKVLIYEVVQEIINQQVELVNNHKKILKKLDDVFQLVVDDNIARGEYHRKDTHRLLQKESTIITRHGKLLENYKQMLSGMHAMLQYDKEHISGLTRITDDTYK